MAFNRNTAKYVNFKGLKTKDESHEVGFDGLVTSQNVDISRSRKPYRRAGYAQSVSDTVDSAWGTDGILLYTSGADLKYFDASGTGTIRSDMTPEGKIVAYSMGTNLYYSNGHELGVFDTRAKTDRTFGLEVPASLSLSSTHGSLPAGKYMATTVFVRGDGQISGAGIAAVIDLPSGGGVAAAVSSSDDPTIVYVDLYLSTPNGTEMYKANRAVVGSSEIVYRGDIHNLQVPLRTQFRRAPYAFSEIEHSSSRLLFGVGNMLVYTEPFNYELIDTRSNFIPFTSNVVMIASVDSGVFVGTTEDLWFLSGSDIKEASATLVDSHGIVPHTKAYARGNVISRGEIKENLPFWVSKNNNICLGLPDGSVDNITEKKAIIPEGLTGAALFRQKNGQNHYIAVVNS